MNTTELIERMKQLEYGASGRPREISFRIPRRNGKHIYLSSPEIHVDSTGDGIAGAEITLRLEDEYEQPTKHSSHSFTNY